MTVIRCTEVYGAVIRSGKSHSIRLHTMMLRPLNQRLFDASMRFTHLTTRIKSFRQDGTAHRGSMAGTATPNRRPSEKNSDGWRKVVGRVRLEIGSVGHVGATNVLNQPITI